MKAMETETETEHFYEHGCHHTGMSLPCELKIVSASGTRRNCKKMFSSRKFQNSTELNFALTWS
jgi:hypothetical protein